LHHDDCIGQRDQDPVAGAVTLNKLFKLDVRLMW